MKTESLTPYTLRVPSPVGELVLTATDVGLVGVSFSDHPAPDRPNPDHEVLCRTASQLSEYFSGQRRDFDVPVAVIGTAFQHRVWSTLRTIPYGTTWTYRALATAIGQPTAVRAVGACNGRNALSIVVPCHRVVSNSGALTGYAGA